MHHVRTVSSASGDQYRIVSNRAIVSLPDYVRVARHLDTMRSSQGIERIFAETPELNFAFEGEQMYDSRPKARARKWLSRLLPAKSYAIA